MQHLDAEVVAAVLAGQAPQSSRTVTQMTLRRKLQSYVDFSPGGRSLFADIEAQEPGSPLMSLVAPDKKELRQTHVHLPLLSECLLSVDDSVVGFQVAACALMSSGRWRNASQILSRAIRAHPSDHGLATALRLSAGLALKQNQDYTAAIEQYRLATRSRVSTIRESGIASGLVLAAHLADERGMRALLSMSTSEASGSMNRWIKGALKKHIQRHRIGNRARKSFEALARAHHVINLT